MKYTWDIQVLYPILFILLALCFGFYLYKLGKLKNDGIFFIHQFCFWTSIYTAIKINDQYTLTFFLDHKESLWIILFFSILFYSIFLFIPANLITMKFRSRKLWLYISYILAIPSIVIFISWPSIYTSILLTLLTSFAAASSSTTYLFYSETYQNRIFPFSTISLIYTVLLFGDLFSSNLISIISLLNNGIDKSIFETNLIYYLIIFLIILIFFIISLFILFLIKEDSEMFGYCNIQFEEFEPFVWLKGIVIYLFLFFVVLIEEIGHGLLFNWMLEQNAYTKYHHNADLVNLFSRLSTEIYLFAQIIFGFFFSIILIKKIGVKYTFGLGLLLEFLYFSMMSFNSNPIIFLVLDFICAVGFILILLTLMSLVLMWQTRTPRKMILPIFSIIYTSTSFLTQYIIKLLSETNFGIFKLKNGFSDYDPDDNVTQILNNQTTIIFTFLSVISLCILLAFYYCSEFILAEYKNYIYFANKMNEIKINKIKNKHR